MKMLDHVSIAVTDIDRARRFYDPVMAALGIEAVVVEEGWIGYGARADRDHPERTYLSVRALPGARADGRHCAFKAGSRAAVDRFWAAGLGSGGEDDGAPGLRPAYHSSYYAAFLKDPDGNRVEAVCHADGAAR